MKRKAIDPKIPGVASKLAVERRRTAAKSRITVRSQPLVSRCRLGYGFGEGNVRCRSRRRVCAV